jgi:hypothetical protein
LLGSLQVEKKPVVAGGEVYVAGHIPALPKGR